MKAGWIKTTLGEAFTTSTGSTPSKSDSEFYGQFMPLVKPPELCDSTLDTAEDGLSKAGAQIARTLPSNSILVSCIGNLGKIGMNTVPVAFNQQINAIHPDTAKAIPEFMFFQTLSEQFREQLEAMASGTTVPIVNKSKFNSIAIVLPPLPEQQRIVTLLDEAFDGIATARAHAEKNLQNARAIFESHLQSVFTNQGTDWKCLPFEKAVDSACTMSYGIVQPGEEYPDGLPIVRPTDLGGKIIEIEGLKRIDPTLANSYRRTTLRGGDILLCVRGTTGQISVASAELAGANVTRGIVPIFFERTLVAQDFGYYLMRSDFFQSQIRDKTYGTALQQINIGDLRNLTLPIPPLFQQEALTSKFDDLGAETQRLESLYQHKLRALDEFKKSLLAQAFSGAL